MRCTREPNEAKSNRLCSKTDGPDQDLQRRVRAYIRYWRDRAEAELQLFRRQPSLAKAIHYAALSTDADGKRHSHEHRRQADALATAERTLQAAARGLRNCRSFAELHDAIYDEIHDIYDIGFLTIYDIATRVGAYVGLEPDLVYLHAGTGRWRKALGLNGGKTLQPTALPRAFRALRPREIEDCLCIYKSDLWRLRSNDALQQPEARVARSGC